jgi:hypothetical protein
MLRLRSRSGCSALTQLASGGFTSPRAGVDLARDAQPLFGLGKRREVTHVQSKALAAFLEATADEKSKAPELGHVGLRERHGRRGRAQIEHERPCAECRGHRTPGFRACIGSEVWCCCHSFPEPKHSTPRPCGLTGFRTTEMGVRPFALWHANVAAPPS